MIKKLLTVALIAGFVMVGAPGFAVAQEGDDDSVNQSLAEQIADLLEQVQMLQAQLAELRGQAQDVRTDLRETRQLVRDLSIGMSGEDVETLQELLASDPEIYPEGLVTGYFGPLTQRAVERLQDRFGIDTVGRVGPITKRTVNRLFHGLNSGKGSLNRGPGNIFDRILVDDDDDDDDSDDIDLSEFVPGVINVLVCHMPPGNPNAAHTIAVGGPAVQIHLAHGDSLGACDDDDVDELDDEDQDEDDDDEDEDDEDEEDEDVDDDDEIDVDHSFDDETGTHTISGSVMVANTCQDITAVAEVTEGDLDEVVIVLETVEDDDDDCEEEETEADFSVSFEADENAEISATLDGEDVELDF